MFRKTNKIYVIINITNDKEYVEKLTKFLEILENLFGFL